MAITLSDDGTMDTVLRCSDCGKEFRFNYDPTGDEAITNAHCLTHEDHVPGCAACARVAEKECEDGYAAFVEWAITDATDTHDCENAAPIAPATVYVLELPGYHVRPQYLYDGVDIWTSDIRYARTWADFNAARDYGQTIPQRYGVRVTTVTA